MSAKLKHSGQRFWKKGILPSNRKHLADHVDAAIKEITEDLGGVSALTGAQRVMLAQLRRCLIFLALIDRWIADHAFIDDKGNLAPAMSAFYLSALNSSLRIVKDLGLERKTQGESLEAYLEKKRCVAQDAQTPTGKGKGKGRQGKPVCARPEREGGEE